MKKKATHYFKTDLERLLKRYGFYISVLGVAMALFFALEDYGVINNSVMDTYISGTEMSGMMLVYIFCAFPYAPVIVEDIENKYVRCQLIRGDLRRYVASKIFVIYASSIVVMVAGTCVFLALLRTQIAWEDPFASDLGVLMAGSYADLLLEKRYFLYCFFYSLQLGLLAGTLSVFAAFVSLYISNKVTVLAIPMLAYQILLNASGTATINIFSFRAYNKIFSNNFCHFSAVVCLSLLPVFLCTAGIYKKLKDRL